MIMAGAIERAAGAEGPRFIIKGGVALELRLRDQARATKDIDIVLRDAKADLSDALERAVGNPPEPSGANGTETRSVLIARDARALKRRRR
jgi:hypothetical protein